MELGFGALLSIALGVGLAAATGSRVFLPLLIAAIAARSGAIAGSRKSATRHRTASPSLPARDLSRV